MGWGTTFTTEIYLSRLRFENIYQLEDKIREECEYLERIKNKLFIMVGSDMMKVIPEDSRENPISWIEEQVVELMTEYDETLINISNLELLKDDFDNRVTD